MGAAPVGTREMSGGPSSQGPAANSRANAPQIVQGVPLLEAREVHKHYGAVQALRGASISVQTGEIMGLVGDNGAGKSTLIKILSGAIQPSSGTIHYEDVPVSLSGPADALDLGIETVYQDLSLVESMSALQNIFLGKETLRAGAVGAASAPRRPALRCASQALETLNHLGARLPSLDEKVVNLSGGQRQAVAIARSLLWGRKLVIFDEPTAALGVNESMHALETIASLRDRGITVLVISHNLEQLFSIADRVTVLRLGQCRRRPRDGPHHSPRARRADHGSAAPATPASPGIE